MPNETPIQSDHPLKKAWDAYKATEDYANSKGWALQTSPMIQVGDPDAERKRRYELMPFDQRERHVEGSLWSAFVAGFSAAGGSAAR